MSWGNESRNLTDEISVMHEARDNYMNHLRNDIQQKKNNWNEERKNMKADLLAHFSACDSARAKEVTDLRSATNAFLKEFRKENKERAQDIAQFKVEVGRMITGFKEDRDEATASWQDLRAYLGKGGEKKKQTKKTEVTSQISVRGKKIMAIVKENPEGITLPEIAYIMGVAFVTITRDIKTLLKDGLIKKEENKYFSG